MFKFLIAVFLSTLIAFPAAAQERAADYDHNPTDTCESWPNVPVNINPRFDEPVYDYTANIATIQSLASDPTRTVHGGHHGIVLGLTRYMPIISFNVPIKIVQFPDGLSCAHVDHVDVTFGYKDVTVYVPREIPENTCGFDQVIKHEQKHIAVNQQLLQEYTVIIQQKLQAYLKANGVFRETNTDYAVSLLKQRLKTIMDETTQQMLAENQRRQHLVDSPEEYRRVNSSCNGQLMRAATQYMRDGR